VTGYNATVHSSSGIAPARFTDSDVLAIWKRLQRKKKREHVIKDKYSVRKHVRRGKIKVKFARSAEQNFSTEIFRIVKVIPRTPKSVYEDLNKRPIDGSFYQEELTPVVVTNQTQFKIHKILSTRVRRGIKDTRSDGWVIVQSSIAGSKRQALWNCETQLWNSDNKSYYITLFSNALTDVYALNSQSSFTNRLAHPIDLGSDSDWVLRLAENTFKPPLRTVIQSAVFTWLVH